MWRVALFAPLLVAGSNARPQADQQNNSTATFSSSVSQDVSLSLRSSLSAAVASQSDSETSSPIHPSSSSPESPRSTPSPATSLEPSTPLPSSTPSKAPSTRFTTPGSGSGISISIEDIVRPSRTTASPSSSRNVSAPLVSQPSSSGNASMPWTCTGCVLQAPDPLTTFFTSDFFNQWSATTVTATIVTEFTTYNDTVVTNTRTLNQTSTIHSGDDVITHTAPSFTIQPMPGTYLTLEAGPTYVIYNSLEGGILTPYTLGRTSREFCNPKTSVLSGWRPTRTEDWNYFIESFTTSLPVVVNTMIPASVPQKAVQYLQSNAVLASGFEGANLATCTVFTPQFPGSFPKPTPAFPAPDRPGTSTTAQGEPVFTQFPPPFATAPTQTYISVSYETTSQYTTILGCLRAGCGAAKPTSGPANSEQGPKVVTEPGLPNVIEPTNGVVGTDKPTDVPSNDQGRPGNNGNQGSPGHVTIGDSAYNVRPGSPTSRPGQQPNEPNGPPPPVIIGTETLTQGQSTNINGVPVVVPTNGGGSRVVIGGTTIVVNNGPTIAPVLTVGRNAVTANPQGQYVVGSQTLRPGGPAVTVDGSTLSLGPGGSIAVVNGVTQTIAYAPIITSPPVITVGGRVVSATVIGGTTQVVLGDQILAPGSAITISGTTYSLPPTGGSAGVIVIANGVTSTLSPGIKPVVQDGTTAFIFGPGQTLTPGGVVTVSGTTYSMPANNLIVINGVTSTFGSGPLTAAPELTINGRTYTATTRDGTIEFVLAPGLTLRAGQAVTMSGTTYSLDPQGTALIVNGATSSIPVRPASNSASTTASSTRGRDAGDFIWSGIGGGNNNANDGATSRGGAQGSRGGLDKWVENAIIGFAGWLFMLV